MRWTITGSIRMTDARDFAGRTLVGAIMLGAAAAILFLAWPEIDLQVSALFADRSFAFGESLPVRQLRSAFNLLFIAGCVAAAFGLIVTLARRTPLFGWTMIEWFYFAGCLLIGPGLVANFVLKGHWGRARPIQTDAFGGPLTFTPPLILSDQCTSNCSFVAGEASSIFMLFLALAMLVPRHRTALMLSAIVLGCLAGTMRIIAGGHYLSDVVFAGVFMAVTASLLYLAIPRRMLQVRPGAEG